MADLSVPEILYAKQRLLDFLEERNQWETAIYKFRPLSNLGKPDSEKKTKKDLIDDYYMIIEKYCTKKKTKYTRHPGSWGSTPLFDGYQHVNYRAKNKQ